MAVNLNETLVRDPNKTIAEAHVDPNVLPVPHDVVYDPDTKTLTVDGIRQEPGGQYRTYSDTVPLEHVPGGDSFGDLVATSSAVPASGGTRGAFIRLTFTIPADKAAAYTSVAGALRHALFDSSGDALHPYGNDVDGFWVVPRRGATELRNLRVFVPLGPDTNDASSGNYETEKVLRFDNDAIALIIHYATIEGSRFNQFLFSHPLPTQWDLNLDRADYSIAIYEHNVVGPAGPAGQGSHPPFGLEQLTQATQTRIEQAFVRAENDPDTGSDLTLYPNRGDPTALNLTPSAERIYEKTGGGTKFLDEAGNFTQVNEFGAETHGKLQGIETQVAHVATYETASDAADVTLSFSTADAVDVPVESATGADVTGKITQSVVSGQVRWTIGATGLANLTWMKDYLLRSTAGTGTVDWAMVVTQYASNGTVKNKGVWTRERTFERPTTTESDFSMLIATGIVPVDVGDYFEVKNTADPSVTGGNMVYRRQAAGASLSNRVSIVLLESIAGAVTSQSHTDGQISRLADIEIARAHDGLGFDQATNQFTGAPTVQSTQADVSTPEKVSAWQHALQVNAARSTTLPRGTDLNNYVQESSWFWTESTKPINSPLGGPFIFLVDTEVTQAGTYNLTQWLFSLNSPGLYATRHLVGQAAAPTSISEDWHTYHSIAQLPALPDDATSVKIGVVTRNPARYAPVPFVARIQPSAADDDRPGAPRDNSLYAPINAFGVNYVRTYISAGSGEDLRNRLILSVRDTVIPRFTDAFGNVLPIPIGSGVTFFYRPEGRAQAFERQTGEVSTGDDGAGNIIFRSDVFAGGLIGTFQGNWEMYMQYTDRAIAADAPNAAERTRYIHDTYQPSNATENSLDIPTKDGKLDIPDAVPENRKVPGGGTDGQALLKASDNDYDTAWGDVAAAGGGTPDDGSVTLRQLAADVIAALLPVTGDSPAQLTAKRTLIADLLNAATADVQRLSYDELKDKLTGGDIVTLIENLSGADRLDFNSLKNPPTGGGTPETGATIVAKLMALRLGDRLSYNVLKETPDNRLMPAGGTDEQVLAKSSDDDYMTEWVDAQSGPAGPQGEPGPRGLQGPQGDPGTPGAAGAQGPRGMQGPQGNPGQDGQDGTDGAPGQRGPAGQDGSTGPRGPAGAAGRDGTDGAVGPEGPAGPQGPAADADRLMPVGGTDGQVLTKASGTDYDAQWEDASGGSGGGQRGPTGPQGPQGEQGPKGDQGDRGPAGPQGDQGIQGPAGSDGRDGVDGAVGAQGPMGLRGLQGAAGTPGRDGTDGTDGTPGATGPRGPEGPEGPEGPAGPTGPAGQDAPTNQLIPDGGTDGQVLTKQSGTDYDAEWENPTGASGVSVATALNELESTATLSLAAVTTEVEHKLTIGALTVAAGHNLTRDATNNRITSSVAQKVFLQTSLPMEVENGPAGGDRTLPLVLVKVNGVTEGVTRGTYYHRGPSRTGLDNASGDSVYEFKVQDAINLNAGDYFEYFLRPKYENSAASPLMQLSIASTPLKIQTTGLTVTSSGIRDFAKTSPTTTDAAARTDLATLMNASASDAERFDYDDLKNKPSILNYRDVNALPTGNDLVDGLDVYLLVEQIVAGYGVLTAGTINVNTFGYFDNPEPTADIGTFDAPHPGIQGIYSVQAADSSIPLRDRIVVTRVSTETKVPSTVSIAEGTGNFTDYTLTASSIANNYVTATGNGNRFLLGQGYRVKVAYSDGSVEFASTTYLPGRYVYSTTTLRWNDGPGNLSANDIRDLFAPQAQVDNTDPWPLDKIPAGIHGSSLVEIHDGPGVGVSVTTPLLNQYGAETLFSGQTGLARRFYGPTFDLDRVSHGEFHAEVAFTITARSANTISFTNTTVADDRITTSVRTSIIFASRIKALGDFDIMATQQEVVIMSLISVFDSTTRIGQIRILLFHDSNNQLGYVTEWRGTGSAALGTTLSIGVNLEISFTPTDPGPALTISNRGRRIGVTTTILTDMIANDAGLGGVGATQKFRWTNVVSPYVGDGAKPSGSLSPVYFFPPKIPPNKTQVSGLTIVSKVGTEERDQTTFLWGGAPFTEEGTSFLSDFGEAILFFYSAQDGATTTTQQSIKVRWTAFPHGGQAIAFFGNGTTLPANSTIEIYEYGAFLT